MKKILLSFCLVLLLGNVSAQHNIVDLSFNVGQGPDAAVTLIRVQTDGKMVVAGQFANYNGIATNIVRINTDGSIDNTFNSGTGANLDIMDMVIQPDGKIIIVGWFSQYNGVNVPCIARLNQDGTLDNSFNVGQGPNNLLWTVSLKPNGKIIIGGEFTEYDGTAIGYVAILNSDGSLDTSFNPNLGLSTFIPTVMETVLLQDDRILISANFEDSLGFTNFIGCVNPDGSLDATFNIGGSGIDDYIYKGIQQPDGKIIIAGRFQSYNGIARKSIARINPDGSMDNTFNPGTGPVMYEYVETIELQPDGKILVGGAFDSFSGISCNNIIRLNANGSYDFSFYAGSSTNPNTTIISISYLTDDKILLGGSFTEFDNIPCSRIVRLNETQSGIVGNVFLDMNQNCTFESSESGIHNRILTINPGGYVVRTVNGYWYIDSLPAGNYTVTADTPGNWVSTCPVSQSFTITDPDSLYYAPNFGFVSATPCPTPEISVKMPFMRPGFSNQSISIQTCNGFQATGLLTNGIIELEIDPLIIPQSATQSYTSLGGNKYKFILNNDTLNPGQCELITVFCSLSASAVLNSTLCMKVNLSPADSCVFDTIPNIVNGVAPCTLPWDKSSLKVTGTCTGDSIRFVVYNHGSGNMQCYAPVRIYINGAITTLDSIMLTSGDSAVYVFLGDGKTWRLEADQHPLHPGNSHPNATVENCNPGTWTPNLVNVLPQDDADPVVDIFCGLVRGSYDPNDKTGYPLGINSTHDIMPNQQLEYVIRFQNTGTDTAFTVVIRDTLDTDLDIFSVVSGASSHKYNFRMYGKRVLEWTFNNILLPDSNVNEAMSHGFVSFTVEQNKNLTNGTELSNTAGIYFDYNAPVITNTTVHTVNESVQSTVTSQKSIAISKKGSTLRVYPNPADSELAVSSPKLAVGSVVEIWNVVGVKMLDASTSSAGQVVVDISDLPKGMYVVKAGAEAVKLVVE